MKRDMPIRHSTIRRRRIRTVIDRLMLIAGHLTVHVRKYVLVLGQIHLSEYLMRWQLFDFLNHSCLWDSYALLRIFFQNLALSYAFILILSVFLLF